MTDEAQLECDMLAQIIRTVDGENKLGAGALAEAILAHCSLPMQDRDALAARLEEAECDLKDLQDRIEVKGGGADAPTQWAYEQACAALHRHKERADDAERQRDAIETTYSQACDDYSAAHVAQQEAERQRDYVAARLIEAEEKIAAYEAMHEAAQKDGGPNVLRRQLELRRYKVRAEQAERQRDEAGDRAMEEAASHVVQQARDTLNGLSEYEAGVAADSIRHLASIKETRDE